MNNVINLATRRKVKDTPAEELEELEDDRPWHVQTATGILFDTIEPGSYPLSDREKRFVATMATLQTEPTPKQESYLAAIMKRVEAVKTVLSIDQAFRERERMDSSA
jgi:hypothetical protein